MRAWKIAVPVLLVALAGWLVERCAGTLATETSLPTARVQQGDLRLDVRTTGELQNGQSTTLFAPPVGGGTLQIVHLDPDGTVVKRGDVVLQFDPSEQEYNLETNRSDLEEARQEIIKAKAQTEVQNSDDRLALLKAKFAVRNAELQVQKNPLLAAIDAKKNVLALDQAKRTLAQLEQDIQSHASSNQATLQVAQARFDKAKVQMDRAESNIKNMTIRSPIAGVVKIRENRDSTGGFYFTGMTIPEFRDGDQTFPGTPVADVLDMGGMQIMARVTESERPSIRVGEPAEIRVDAIPNQVFSGKVMTVAGMAQKSIWEASPTGTFDLTVSFDHSDARLRPGFTAHLTLVGQEEKGALFVPRVAIFQKDGKAVVYVEEHGEFIARDVKLVAETPAWAVIEGPSAGDEVALVNPVAQSKSDSGNPAGPALQGAQR